jgi:hypothetical protein
MDYDLKGEKKEFYLIIEYISIAPLPIIGWGVGVQGSDHMCCLDSQWQLWCKHTHHPISSSTCFTMASCFLRLVRWVGKGWYRGNHALVVFSFFFLSQIIILNACGLVPEIHASRCLLALSNQSWAIRVEPHSNKSLSRSWITGLD